MTIKSNVRDVPKICIICSNKFMAARHRSQVAKYCSPKCYHIAMKHVGGVDLKCEVCGKEYRRPPCRSKFKTKTCSLKCRGIATRTPAPTSEDYPSVRKWLKRRGLIDKCVKCGYDDEPNILVVHHSDRDRRNNALSNLEILCPNCHAIEHLSEQKNGFSHASTKRKRRSDIQLQCERDG